MEDNGIHISSTPTVYSTAILEGFTYLQPSIPAELSASPAATGTQRVSRTQRVSHTQRVFCAQRVSCTQRASQRQANSQSHYSSRTPRTLERPNTDASFSVSVSTEPLPPSAANVLRADGISELLKTYPNQRFMDTLLSITLYGARIGFEGITSGHGNNVPTTPQR